MCCALCCVRVVVRSRIVSAAYPPAKAASAQFKPLPPRRLAGTCLLLPYTREIYVKNDSKYMPRVSARCRLSVRKRNNDGGCTRSEGELTTNVSEQMHLIYSEERWASACQEFRLGAGSLSGNGLMVESATDPTVKTQRYVSEQSHLTESRH